MDPKLKEFLRYALSRDGQQMVSDGGYLPLSVNLLQEQLARLE